MKSTRIIITVIFGGLFLVGLSCQSAHSFEHREFVNPWGQPAKELVISPVNGTLTLDHGANNGAYHKIALPIPVDHEISELGFNAQLIAVDKEVTVIDDLEFVNNNLPAMDDIEVQENDLGYLGIKGPIPGKGLPSGRLFKLFVKNGALFLRTRFDDSFTRKDGAAPAPASFDLNNLAGFGFGFIEGLQLVPGSPDRYEFCLTNLPFDSDGPYITDYQITQGSVLLQDGFIMATTRVDINLGLFDCMDDHVDHYYLKFELNTVESTVSLGATLFRFGSDLDLSDRTMMVGELQKKEDDWLPEFTIADTLSGLRQDILARYQASATVIERLNQIKAMLEDVDSDGFVELPLYVVDVSNAFYEQEFSGGSRISDLSWVTRPIGVPSDLLVISRAGGAGTDGDVLRYDGKAGAFISEFSDGGCNPVDLTYGPDGRLYVADKDHPEFGGCDPYNVVTRFDGKTGEFKGFDDPHANFIPLFQDGRFQFGPGGLAFGPDGNLYLSDPHDNSVHRYQGPFGANPGAFINTFVSSGHGGLNVPTKLVFGPDNNLYVNSWQNDRVLRYQGPLSGSPGAFIDEYVSGRSGGLDRPTDLTFGQDERLYVASFGSDAVLRYKGPGEMSPGAFIDEFSPLPFSPHGTAFGSDGDLYITGSVIAVGGFKGVQRYDGQTGSFKGNFAFVRSPGELIFSAIPDLVADLGDFNNDGCVDLADLTNELLPAIRSGSTDLKFDLNGDGPVNIADARKLVNLFTNTNPRGASCNY